MNLFSATNCLLLWEMPRLPSAKKKQLSARGATAEVGYSPRRLRGASGLKEIQWQLGIFPDTHQLGNQWGVWGLPIGFSAHFWAAKSGPAGGKTALRAAAAPSEIPGGWGRGGPIWLWQEVPRRWEPAGPTPAPAVPGRTSSPGPGSPPGRWWPGRWCRPLRRRSPGESGSRSRW